MNFSPFGGPFSTSIPGIHQFAASQALGSANNHNESINRYSSNGSTPGNLSNVSHFNQVNIPLLSKYRGDDNLNTNNTMMQKYNGHTNNHLNLNSVQYQANVPTYTPSNHLQTTINDDKQRLNNSYQQSTNSNASMHQTQSESAHDICNAILGQQTDAKRVLQNSSWQSLTPSSAVADYLSHLPASTLPLSLHHFLKYSAESIKKESQNQLTNIDSSHTQNLTHSLGLNSLSSSSLLSNTTTILNQPQQHQIQALQSPQQLQHHISIPQTTTAQSLNVSNSTNITPHASSMNSINQNANLPSNGNEAIITNNNNNGCSNGTTTINAVTTAAQSTKKKKKKKPPKEKKPRPKPGEIRLTTALDGSTLYGCPECHMVYPERGLLEEHLVGHNLERRFECDMCQARLKRKDHLTRHKQSHNPDRPFSCSVCAKTFKRKEQLTLHFVIHSGEKRHICLEDNCNKAFYRKDHLRKHTRSHIARRVKAELSQQNLSPNLIAAQQLQQQNQLNSHQIQIQNNSTFS